MNPNEAMEELYRVLAIIPELKSERARGLLYIFPYLPLDVRRDLKDQAWEALYYWNKWGYVDTPYYIEAMEAFFPYLSEDQMVDFWIRAVGEHQSGDLERQWFAERSMVKMIKHLPIHRIRMCLGQVEPDEFRNDKAKSDLLFVLAARLPQRRNELLDQEWYTALMAESQN